MIINKIKKPTWSFKSSQIALKFGFALIFGNRIWTDARTVVPKLVGQKVNHPRRSSRENGTFPWIVFTPKLFFLNYLSKN